MRRLRPIPALLLLALAFAELPGVREAKASGQLTVAVQAPAGPVLPGDDATFIIRVEGDSPDRLNLDFSAVGGTLSGVVALNDVSPGVAEGAAYVRRDTPGEATLTVLVDGKPVATGSVTFALTGRVELQVALEAGPTAAARTWRFEVIDAAGNVVASLSLGLSGDAPAATGRTGPLPFGSYFVHPVLRTDTQSACSPGVTYAIGGSEGGVTPVSVAGPLVAVRFSARLCPDGAQQAVTGEIAATRGVLSATPLPPKSGNAPAADRPASRDGWLWAALAGTLLSASVTLLPGRRRSPLLPPT